MIAAELRGEDLCPRLGVMSLHLPPKATLDQTEHLLSRWGSCRHISHPQVIVGFDTSEMFDFDLTEEGRAIVTCRTARGEAILEWGAVHGLTLHEQDHLTNTFFPCNTFQRPRRLNYICTKGIAVHYGGLSLKAACFGRTCPGRNNC